MLISCCYCISVKLTKREKCKTNLDFNLIANTLEPRGRLKQMEPAICVGIEDGFIVLSYRFAYHPIKENEICKCVKMNVFKD